MLLNWKTPVNAFRSALRAGLFAVREHRIVAAPQTVEARLMTCARCPELDMQTMQCKHCLCFIRVKVNLASERCPKGYWKQEKL